MITITKKNAFNSRGVLFLVFIGLAVTVAALAKTSHSELTEVAEEKTTTDAVAALDVPEATNEVAISQQLTEQNATLEMPSSAQLEPLPETRPPLAAIVNGKSIDDDPYTQEYLQWYNSFENVSYETVVDVASTTMYDGRLAGDEIKGYAINNSLYYIDLIICDKVFNACFFRVNGIPSGNFIAKDDTAHDGVTSFDLDDTFTIGIKRIVFDDCGERRFCDIYWEKQDIVELEIKRK